jgi:hypothetical protein
MLLLSSGELVKFCSHCDRWQLGSKYSMNRATPDGLSNWCTDCNKDYAVIRRERNRQKNAAKVVLGIVPEGEKHCPSCQKSKPVEKFYRDRTTDDGLSTYCQKCTKARLRAQRSGWGKKNDLSRREYLLAELAKLEQ